MMFVKLLRQNQKTEITMEHIEKIAHKQAEQFIRKHFARLHERDSMVRAMRDSLRNIIREALLSYEQERTGP